jgi:hypothetical protein
VVLIWAINFQVSIDGGAQAQYHFDGPCGDCHTFNISVYDNQSLQFGSHTLVLTLLNATGINRALYPNENSTDFSFDYAVVTSPTAPAASTTSTSKSAVP